MTKLYVLALCVRTPRQRIHRLSGQEGMPFADHSDFLFLSSCMAVLSLDSLLLLDFQCCTLKEMVGAGIPSLYQLVGKLCLWYSQPKHGHLLLIDIQPDHPLFCPQRYKLDTPPLADSLADHKSKKFMIKLRTFKQMWYFKWCHSGHLKSVCETVHFVFYN